MRTNVDALAARVFSSPQLAAGARRRGNHDPARVNRSIRTRPATRTGHRRRLVRATAPPRQPPTPRDPDGETRRRRFARTRPPASAPASGATAAAWLAAVAVANFETRSV